MALGKKKKVLSLNQICWYHNMKQEGLLVPSAFLPETNGNRVFAISSTPLDFEIEVREFKGVDMTQEKKRKKKSLALFIFPVTVCHNRKHLDL